MAPKTIPVLYLKSSETIQKEKTKILINYTYSSIMPYATVIKCLVIDCDPQNLNMCIFNSGMEHFYFAFHHFLWSSFRLII